MSTQSLAVLNREKYLRDAEEKLLLFSDLYFYKKKFLLGCGVDRDEMNFYMQNHRFLCTDICEVIEFIQCKIEGREEIAEKKRKERITLRDLIDKYIRDTNCTRAEAEECLTGFWSNDVAW